VNHIALSSAWTAQKSSPIAATFHRRGVGAPVFVDVVVKQ
jgi:hypothetical protein